MRQFHISMAYSIVAEDLDEAIDIMRERIAEGEGVVVSAQSAQVDEAGRLRDDGKGWETEEDGLENFLQRSEGVASSAGAIAPELRSNPLLFDQETGQQIVTPPGHADLWWIANSLEEVEEQKRQISDRGCVLVATKKRGRDYDVIFRVDEARASETLGYEVSEEEFVEHEDRLVALARGAGLQIHERFAPLAPEEGQGDLRLKIGGWKVTEFFLEQLEKLGSTPLSVTPVPSEGGFDVTVRVHRDLAQKLLGREPESDDWLVAPSEPAPGL